MLIPSNTAEHFIYADGRIHAIFSVLLNCFISH